MADSMAAAVRHQSRGGDDHVAKTGYIHSRRRWSWQLERYEAGYCSWLLRDLRASAF